MRTPAAPRRTGTIIDELKAKLEAADAEGQTPEPGELRALEPQHDAVLAKLSQNECAKQALQDFEEVAGEEDEIRHDRSVREGH